MIEFVQHYWLFIVIALALYLGVSYYYCINGKTDDTHKVIKVSDGDTVTIKALTGKRVEERIRIWGVDALEKDQRGGLRAKDALEKHLLNKYVTIERTGESTYDRNVARIFLNGNDVGSWLVRHRWAYDSPTYSKGYYKKDQQWGRIYFWRGLFVKMPWTHRLDKKMHRKFNYWQFFASVVTVLVILNWVWQSVKSFAH